MKYLGNSEQLLGNVNNTRKLVDVVNALLDRVRVVGPGGVQDILEVLNLGIGPLLVCRTTVLGNTNEDAHDAEKSDGLLIDDVQFVADGGDRETGSGGKRSGLGDQAVTGNRVEKRLGLLLGLFGGDIRVRAGRSDVAGDGSDIAGGQSRPQPGGAWRVNTCPKMLNGEYAIRGNIPRALLAKRAAIVAK